MTPKPSSIYEFDALGTRWSLELLEGSWSTSAKNHILAQVTTFEDMYTRFRDSSLIGQLNLRKKLVSPPQELLDMFVFAEKMHVASQGAFNISVGGALDGLGYGDRSRAAAVKRNFWNEVKYNRDEILIPGEATVDLGGFGKGWLIDRLGVLLERLGHSHYLINGGGDILVAATKPIELGLEHPLTANNIIGTTKIKRGALAVSSTVKRRWQSDGKTYHHIIEPTTGISSNNKVISTYVKGPSALIADTCATILLLRPELTETLQNQFALQTIILRGSQLNL
ncbi:MAG: FAD:protein FMN transferase [Candidatus Saccharimonadales bacterium]|jgi:thiamine biosynthesis lipoprotein